MARLIIRPAQKEDYPFILDSWLNSHAESKVFSPFISRELYFKLHRPVVEEIMARSSTIIHMAVNEEDPTLIYGYAVYELHGDIRIFHYIYVKRAFNGFGIATALLGLAPFPMQNIYITHLTHRGKQIYGNRDFTYCFYFLYPIQITK